MSELSNSNNVEKNTLLDNRGILFEDILSLIYEKSPMQKKRIEKFLTTQGSEFQNHVNQFMGPFNNYLAQEKLSINYVVDSYVKMCGDMLAEQIKFVRSSDYSCKSIEQAVKEVYSNKEIMKAYMHGLMISQFLWRNHFMIFKFYVDEVLSSVYYENCIEVGSGHGLFLSQAVKKFPDSKYDVVEISEESIKMTKTISTHFVPSTADINYFLQDITKLDSENKYDFIIFGEVLEHVEEPIVLLNSIKKSMAPDGKCFITTCANCPAIDHIYLFRCVEEICDMLKSAGFKIEKDIHLPVEAIAREKWTARKVGVNYAALISHA